MSPVQILIEDFATELLGRARTGRLLVGIADPPGVGKSTFCDDLYRRLTIAQPVISAILPMDGFHFDNSHLEEMDWLSRKGTPHTFDVGGLMSSLKRLKRNDERGQRSRGLRSVVMGAV